MCASFTYDSSSGTASFVQITENSLTFPQYWYEGQYTFKMEPLHPTGIAYAIDTEVNVEMIAETC